MCITTSVFLFLFREYIYIDHTYSNNFKQHTYSNNLRTPFFPRTHNSLPNLWGSAIIITTEPNFANPYLLINSKKSKFHLSKPVVVLWYVGKIIYSAFLSYRFVITHHTVDSMLKSSH